MTFTKETRNIEEHIRILGRQIGLENPVGLAPSGTDTQPNEYQMLAYDPKLHDEVGAKEQILQIALENGYNPEDVRVWLDSARLCAVCSAQDISLKDAYTDPAIDRKVVKMVTLLNKSLAYPLFDSDVFRTRFQQPLYRPWLYLIGQFTDVWVCQQWQRENTLFIMGTLIAGPVVPEWFKRSGDPHPIVIRDQMSSVQLNVKQTTCIYQCSERRESLAQILLVWLYLTHCSADRQLRHVLFVHGRTQLPVNQDDVPIRPAEYVGTDVKLNGLSVITREFADQRFFPTYRLRRMLEAHARPGFSVERSKKFDFALDGRRIVDKAPGPGSVSHSSVNLEPPPALNQLPPGIKW
jgi:hypothetical protein